MTTTTSATTSDIQTVVLKSGTPSLTAYYYTKNNVGYLEFHTYLKLENYPYSSSTTAWTSSNNYGLWAGMVWGDNNDDGFYCQVTSKLSSTSDTFACYDIYVNSAT